VVHQDLAQGFRSGAVALGVVGMGMVLARPGAAQEWTVTKQVRLESRQDGLAVIRAIEGALHRLGDPKCQAVLTEFTDSDGRGLEEVLEAREESAEDRLRKLLFYDRKDRSRCGALSPLAATAPGSRVVFVCGQEFRHAAERSLVRAEAIVIHEFLHSLGLGENPPTSMEIKNAVLARCAS
jgi:hypothetical protein